jgi:N-methylhydantoinase A
MTDYIVGVDVGGTFTDVVASSGGEIIVAKVATNPSSSDESVLAGAAEVGVESASVFNLASTAGLNAVITRNLPKVALLTTEGHRDILDAGRIGRPVEALTDPHWRRGFGDSARPLIQRYLRRGIRERTLASGEILVPLDEAQAREQLAVLRRCGVRGVAICLLHSYANGEHERQLLRLVREELGDVPCSLSSEVSPLAKEFVRTSTTVVDILMKVLYTEYTNRLEKGLADLGFNGNFNYADSRAMLLSAEYAMESPYRLVVGGPAAGTASSAHFGSQIADGNLICADVGGTSCDISIVVDGQPWNAPTFELEYDLVVNAMSTDIVTLGAGGGSVISVSHSGDIQTGPESAGADPGPACYGAGGQRPTLTDTALLMGILDPDRFLGGKKQLFPELAEQAFEGLDTNLPMGDRVRFAWAMGLHNIAEGIMNIVVRRGIDVRDFSLMAFGAAGPMLLPSILELLPMRRVIVPPHPGLFSALGLVSSDQVYSDHRSKYLALDAEAATELEQIFGQLEKKLFARVQGDRSGLKVVRSFDGRLVGQSWETPFIPVPDGTITGKTVAGMVKTFHDAYERASGNRFEAIPVQGVVYRVQIIMPSLKIQYESVKGGVDSKPNRKVELCYVKPGSVGKADIYERSSLGRADVLQGPAVVQEAMSTTFIPEGRRATVGTFGELVIE